MSGENEQMKIVGHDYLWDQTGPVDEDIARLERALMPLRHQHRAQDVPRMHLRLPLRRTSLAAAAVLMLAILGVWLAAMSLRLDSADSVAGWQVTAIQGNPRIGSEPLKQKGVIRVGQWLETDAQSQAKVDVATIGTVTVDSESRVRLVASSAQEHRLELERGTIEAFITAPPRLFFVNTPSATAIDLGCKYALSVDDDGGGILEVTLGWVSLENASGGVESIVPYGAMCKTRSGVGPGTPYFITASTALQNALEQFDFHDQSQDALSIVLAEATERDSLTLWHLLARTPRELRDKVYERLASFAPPPLGVSRHAIVNGDRFALNQWRDTFMWSPNPPMSEVK